MHLHLVRRGDARTSLAIAERVKARSLGDLMSREHWVSLDCIPAWFRSRLVDASGNVQSIEPATLAEVAQSVHGSGSALLVYIKRDAQFMAWSVLPSGVLSAWTFDAPQESLAGIFSALPYLAPAKTSPPTAAGRARREVPRPKTTTPARDGHLRSLWERLIPAEFEPRLAGCRRARPSASGVSPVRSAGARIGARG